MLTPCPTERSRVIADRVERFVRDVLEPRLMRSVGQDMRRHHPAIRAGVLDGRAAGTHAGTQAG